MKQIELPEPIAYLKFWAYFQVTQDGNANADDGLEVGKKGDIGADGVEAEPTYSEDQMRAYGRQYAIAALEEALYIYSPDDTASDYLTKIEDLKGTL